MKTQNSFNVNFFLKRDKASNGMAPIYARITVNGKFSDLSLKRKVRISAWNQKEQKLDGSTEEGRLVREKIRQERNAINRAYDDLCYEKQLVTPESVKALMNTQVISDYLNFMAVLT